jgi:predicted nucleotidyltransferase
MNTDIKLNQITQEVAQGVQGILGKKLQKIILYGFYARGDYNDESDIDIMVLADVNDSEKQVFQRAIDKIASAVSLRNDIIVCISLNEAQLFHFRADFLPFNRNVLSEGVELHALQ